MKLRTATPILLASASIMVCGLVASAQQQPQVPTPRLPLQTQQRIGLVIRQQVRDANKNKNKGKQPAEAGDRAEAPAAGGGAAGGGTAGGGTAGGGTGNITPFETGIDFQPTSPRTRVTFTLLPRKLCTVRIRRG